MRMLRGCHGIWSNSRGQLAPYFKMRVSKISINICTFMISFDTLKNQDSAKTRYIYISKQANLYSVRENLGSRVFFRHSIDDLQR